MEVKLQQVQPSSAVKKEKGKTPAERLRDFCEAIRIAGYQYTYKTALFIDKAQRHHKLYSKDKQSWFEFSTEHTDRPEMATIVRCGIFLVFFPHEEEICELAREAIKAWPPESFSRHPREIKPTVYGQLNDQLFIDEDHDVAEAKRKLEHESV